jgi:predicted nucleic acid-binding Zn ribbon protein
MPTRMTRPSFSAAPPKPISDVMDSVIDRMGVRTRMDEARVVEAWGHVAGLRINRVTDRAWVKHGTLYVRVVSAAWRTELHLQRHAWCSRLNQHLGSDLVKAVAFK